MVIYQIKTNMFSAKEKKFIAKTIEDIIRDLNHPEMDNENIKFQIHIDGKESWSFADIRENKKDDPDLDKNLWNEASRHFLGDQRVVSKIDPMLESMTNGLLRYLLDMLQYANIKNRKQAIDYITIALSHYTRGIK